MKFQKEEIRILLADADFIWLEELKVALEGEGFQEIKVCMDGESAIRETTEYMPHIVITDQLLKHLDGLTIMQYIKDNNLPVNAILTSSYVSNVLLHKAAELEAQFIITKPVQEEVVVARVKDIVDLKLLVSDVTDEIEEIIEDQGVEYELDQDPLLIVDEIGLESNIGRILMGFGIRSHLKGYKYLKTAIVLNIMNEQITTSMTKELYPLIARKYNTTASNIERDMRHAIETAWQSTHTKYKEVYFGRGSEQVNEGKKPHNSLFISSVAEKIRHNLKGQIALMSI